MSELTTRIAVDALGFAPGGGLTYLVNQARALEARDDGFAYTWFVSPRCADQVRTHMPGSDVRVPFESQPPLPVRLAWEQLELPRIVAREGFDAIYAMGSFGVRRSPVPQAVLGANPLHHAGLGVIRPW